MCRAVYVVVLTLFVCLITARPGVAAGPAELLADINPAAATGSSSSLSGPLIPLGNKLLFKGYEPSSGEELWVSDGSPLGARMLFDVSPGPDSGDLRWLGTVRQTAIFTRLLEFREIELWRSDGTAAGTSRISEPSAGPVELCGDGQPVVAGNQLFFLAARPTFDCGLWKTDGTAAGTVRVKALEEEIWTLLPLGNRVVFLTQGALWASDGTSSGTAVLRRFEGNDPEGPWQLTVAGSRATFIAQDGQGGGEELWGTDGTAAGTRLLTRFFEPRPFGEYEGASVQAIGKFIYFLANDGTGWDWWRSDGTGAAPQRVTDFVNSTPFGSQRQILQLGNRLVFLAHEPNVGSGLWSSGGTPQSTVPITGCPEGCPNLGSMGLFQVGQRAVFMAFDPVHGNQLWSTDGTGAGTQRLTDSLCGGGGSCYDATPRFYRFGGKAFFFDLTSQRRALWKSDGTRQGTVRVADLGELVQVSFESLAEAGGKLYFLVTTPRGSQIWVSDGTARGTRVLEHVVGGGGQGSSPFKLTPYKGGLLFGAYENGNPFLWRSDGTPAGTARVADNAFLSYRTFEVGNGLAWFVRVTTSQQHQLWRSDGTAAGTFRLTPDGIGPILNGASVDGRLLFLVADAGDPSRRTFWESDGRVAGTRALSDLPAEAYLPGSFQGFGPRLYFVANDSDTGWDQLWATDGTTTVRLTSFDGYAFLDPPQMALVGSTVFFSADGPLWKTDGTAAGTVQVPYSGYSMSQPVAFQGALYFMAGVEDQKQALFRSDGTGAGTVQIAVVGDASAELTVAGNRLFFVAGDREHGDELWTSDGSADGTRRVRDILPGPGSASPSSLAAGGNKIYFAATDGMSGFEVWESDGTVHGTRRMQDLAPGPQSSNPKELAVSGGRLFFVADDGIHGEEPWVISLTGGGCVPSPEALCLGGRFRVEADWRDFAGNRGAGGAVALTADTGYFWFFDASNVEVILKVLDGRTLNGHHWVFYGALSSVEYTLTVTDTQTGAARRYVNPPGRLGSVADTEAFGPRGASEAGVVTLGPASEMGEAIVAGRTAAVTASCTPGSTRLCLQDGRFAVEARWKKADGTSGAGQTVPLGGGDTGYFWFFDASNVEVVLKVLDGRPLNGKFWVFYGALSDVEYTITVTDTETGAVKTYTNPKGRLASVADTGAF